METSSEAHPSCPSGPPPILTSTLPAGSVLSSLSSKAAGASTCVETARGGVGAFCCATHGGLRVAGGCEDTRALVHTREWGRSDGFSLSLKYEFR